MKKSLLSILADPILKTPLMLDVLESGRDEEIIQGTLSNSKGGLHFIQGSIPRFVSAADPGQNQTEKSFGFKWKQKDTYASPQMQAVLREWLVKRYGFKNIEDMRRFFQKKELILDAGCGAGWSASLWMNEAWSEQAVGEWVGADISEAIDVAKERLGHLRKTHFIQADILQLPFKADTFDAVFSEGVLHHTPSTESGIKSLTNLLKPGAELLFYVYRKKGPLREFTDDFIRNEIASLPPEKAWNALRPLTALGKALADLHAEVDVPEDIPYLGIKAGRYDVQRLIYWHFSKLFWNDSFSFEENNHINFDWYHPRYARRHTEEEIRRWCEECGLTIIHFDTEESGFTVRAVKSGS